MAYAHLVTCLISNTDYCFMGSLKGADHCELDASSGDPVGDQWPRDPRPKAVFEEEWPGEELPSFMGNTRKLLIVDTRVVAAFEQHLDLGPHETLPITLVDRRGRVRSEDYVFLNPFGTHDVAHPSSHFVRFARGGEIYECGKWVLRRDALEGLPDIIRPRELPERYFVSERLIALVKEQGFTNFETESVELV